MARPTLLALRRAAAVTVLGALVATPFALPEASVADPARSAATRTAEKAANPVTPGDFTGYGFDQCHTPDQATMDTWWRNSPFTAIGIYISGKSRACRDQPNLTADWISTQLATGWRLLPITLGPQASCQPRFPRYDDDVRIKSAPGKDGTYTAAVKMGRTEAETTVIDAQTLGIVEGSTLWYDLEGFDATDTDCRESALSFLSGWTSRLHKLGYVAGVYSSAGSGIRELDKARVERPGRFNLPDRIWVARWDGVANTSTSYIAEDGWRPGNRVKQYQGGHDETWGGVRINIDSNFLDLGAGSVATPEPAHCGETRVNFPNYQPIKPAYQRKGETVTPDPDQVSALQCLLKEAGLYKGPVDGAYDEPVQEAAAAWQRKRDIEVTPVWWRPTWMSLLATGPREVLKFGSTGNGVRRVQRALNAATTESKVVVTGVFNAGTERALTSWQSKVDLPVTGVVNADTWKALVTGLRP